MALFQEEQITQEQFNDKYNLNQPDTFSNLGYDDIIKQRQETRQKRIEDEKQWVSNIVSPDKINEWKSQGSMTALQVWHKKNKNELVPYMGSWKEGSKSFDIKHISDKIQTGQVITPEERQKFEDFVLDLAEIQTRGYTFGGGAMNIGLETIPFMAEFGIGLLTSGGTGSVGATSSKLSTEVLKKSLKKQIAEGVKKTVYNATINPRTYAFTATRLPQQVRARMGDIMLSDTVAISPEGQAILKESEEKPAIAFMKALALTNIETASELSGAMLVRPALKGMGELGKVIASPVLKHFPEGFTEQFVKLAEKVTKLPFAKAVDDLGFNGILEEMGEERVGDLLQVAFNLDGEEGYSFEQLLDALFPSPEQLGQEAISFGVTGLGMNAVDKGIKSLPKAGEKYTKDGFLIDAGIFRIAGYDSYLDSKVKEELAKKGKSEEEIDNAINFSTRDDKVQFLKETNTPFDTKKEYDAKEFEKDLKCAEVEDKAYEKLMQGGLSQDVAFANAKLFGQFFKKYGSGNIKAFDEWFDKFDVQYNVPSNQINTFFQSAYHGTPHRFDKFSLDHIGSGEGNQAHGWGLYFAGNKDVSENYRMGLVDKSKSTKYNYGGEPIEQTEFKDIDNQYLSYLFTFGKNETVNILKEDIKYAEEWGEENKNIQRQEILEGNNKYLNKLQKQLKLLERLETEKLTMSEGQLYKVDIPENDVLLDEDKKFSEQPEKVQEAIKKLAEDYNIQELKIESIKHFIKRVVDKFGKKAGDIVQEIYDAEIENNEYDAIETNKMVEDAWDKWNQFELDNNIDVNYDDFNINEIYSTIDKNITGKQIYKTLVSYSSEKLMTDSQREASILLNKYGIKGITYNGKEDGRCYVIFDDNAVDVLKTYYQEANESEDKEEEKLIAGYTYPEVLEKLTELYEKFGEEENKLSEQEKDSLMAKIHVLEDAFDISENPEKFSNEDRRMEVMLNAYYIMNDQEIPENYIDTDKKSARTYNDYVKMHREKKAKKEAEYYGYFTEGQNKNIITIMANHDSSTALHELGHLFLNGLNELARVDKNAEKQLEAVNKWLGYSGEYTVAQQEKFARSFEAYLYKGKAPNNYLRQVFENFKEWLKSVYDDITSLENKGADISDEVQEMFDNMFGGDEYYEERKQANELLKRVKDIVRKEKLEKLPERDNTELDEKSKRYKDVSYEILSVGTGKSVKYLKTIFETDSNKKSFGKKREAIQELLDKVDDKITTSGGMRAHWLEFYGDTGVSYDNDEIDGDYKLVEQALDVIINRSYNISNIENELDERAQYYEKAIDEADRQYKVLLSNFRKGNRNVALSAIYEWLEGLNDEIKQDYEDRFIYDSGVIERNENADKFDKAKRQILSKALELKSEFDSVNDNKVYQETVKQIMRSLDFLQPSDKAKLTANILDVPSVSFLMSSLDNIMDIAKTMEDVNLRRNLEREIHKELQGTKNVKKNGRSVGRYDYRTNKLFEELRELDRLSPERANELRLESGKFATAEDNGLSFKDKLINKFLSYKSGGRTFADTDLMKELYDAIVKIKLAGKSAKSELDLIEKLDETKDIEELINIVQGKKQAGNIIKNYIDKVANLESTLNAIFNKNIKDRYGAEILYAETQAQAWQHEQKQKFEREVAKIYGLPEWCWDKKILEYLGEKHTYPEIRRKYDTNGDLLKTRSVDRTLTKMDIIQAYIWSKNEVLEKRLINQFGEETLEAMLDELSLEDVKFADAMMNVAQSFYPLVNKAFINKYGLDLPKVSCYFPSTPERGSEVDLYNDYSSKSLNNSFTKARAQSETQAMDFHNPVATLYNHIEGVSKFVFMSDSLDRANLRFKDLDLKRVIINKYGEDVYRTLEQALINVTYKKEAPVFNGMNKIIDNMVGNWIQANVAVKPIVGLKQLLSANNYAVDMPYMKWQAGFLKALAHPKQTIDYVMSIPYIKARYEGSYANEFLKQTVENSAFAMSKKLKDACNMFIKMGDIGAIIFGGKPYIDYLIEEKGMSEEQAIKQFILSTNRSQQSSAVSSLSNFQVNMTRNPMGKLFIAFKNSPQQYIRMCGDAIVSTANGDMTKAQCAKMLFQFGYLQPFLYAVATSGSFLRFLFTGDDDDFKKDASMSIFNFGSDALPIIGDIYKYALNRMAYKEKFMPQNTPLLGDIQAEINKISKEDVSLADYLDAVGYLGLHVGLGYNSKAFTNMGSGVGDIAKGQYGQGAMKVLGYTEKRAKHITGNEDKKKK